MNYKEIFKEMATASKAATEDFNDMPDDRAISWAYDEIKRLAADLATARQEIERLVSLNTTTQRHADQLLDKLHAAEKESCDYCVMTGRGPSRLKFENPPIGRAWCELTGGSGVGRDEALLWQEGYREGIRQGREEAAKLADDQVFDIHDASCEGCDTAKHLAKAIRTIPVERS